MLITNYFEKPNRKLIWLSDPPLHFGLTWSPTYSTKKMSAAQLPHLEFLYERDGSHWKIADARMNKEKWGGTYTPIMHFNGPRRTLNERRMICKGTQDLSGKEKGEKKMFVGFLKSNLQKAIRRRNTMVALRTTKTLLLIDPVELLRRLPIILVEDVGVHECIAPLVWFMVISMNGYILEERGRNYIMGTVAWMCNCEKQVVPEKREKFDYRNSLSEQVWNQLSRAQQNTFMALYVRVNYGGTSGDMDMLRFWMEYVTMGRGPLWCENNNYYFKKNTIVESKEEDWTLL